MKQSEMQRFSEIYAAADVAGRAAAEACVPVPMVVGEAKGLFSSEIDRAKPVYVVAGGVCGFAWIKFKGNSAFARWAKGANVGARSSYPSGMQISVRAYGQSMELKEAYARAFAEVLRANGIEAYAESRMD